ncbi:MAG: metalloregulator ArsR/SmtB family transcription factor [Lachnospiraceae bacterium]|nr:metalloregulator ArsR/SmtB family transcription factor [Lachnospiraceae bacterium]
MLEADAIKLFKCLADKSRLQILKSLVQEEMYVERLAERLGLTPATISFHLKKLEDAGAVTSRKEQYYTIYSLRQEVFMTNIIDIIKEESEVIDEQKQREEEYRNKVIKTFFEYGKLKAIPAQRKKQRICLEEISKSFEAGRKYEEKEVNEIIKTFNDDFCTIRRDMISEHIMEREGSTYWLKPEE